MCLIALWKLQQSVANLQCISVVNCRAQTTVGTGLTVLGYSGPVTVDNNLELNRN